METMNIYWAKARFSGNFNNPRLKSGVIGRRLNRGLQSKVSNSNRAVTAFFILLLALSVQQIQSQTIENPEIKSKVEAFKKDAKGPYQQIMWFCPDGSRVIPTQRCPEKGGVQRATYKAWVEQLSQKNHIYLGQILAATDFVQFLDKDNRYSRAKQYQIENYIEGIDNGWILQKAKFYRGAFQDEDENSWGEKFLEWTLTNDSLDKNNFFLLRQFFKAIPHKAETPNIKKVRALSLEIADSISSFMNIRVKIHGQPEASDIASVKEFKRKNDAKLTTEVKLKIDELLAEMEIMFQPVKWESLAAFGKAKGITPESANLISTKVNDIATAGSTGNKIELASEFMLETRKSILTSPVKTKKILLDLSNKLEELIFKELPNWQAETLEDILRKNYALSMAAAGAGYIEIWEWDKTEPLLNVKNLNSVSLGKLNEMLTVARGVVEWSTGMIRANYESDVKTFEGFEPLAKGFPDDLIRSSVLLQLGQSIGELGSFIAINSNQSNQVFDIPNQSLFQGLNPGFAKGVLVVADSPEEIEVSADKIYVFNHPTSDLKPVAGIATVSEGNLVSHVQLLARNLGIPNAVLSAQNMSDLKKYDGKPVFYAVSNNGNIIMKPTENMSPAEKALFDVKKREETKIRVGIDKLDLNRKKVLDLRSVNAASSGKLCGPKAANLGQLKLMFPENVVEGLVIPFGIFRQHMEQKMPGTSGSYWDFLNLSFKQVSEMGKAGKAKNEIDVYILKQLETLSNAIIEMPFLPEFEADLKAQFKKVLGKEMGTLPVFLRSDTNMEDLKDFTGAGLNLTLFNVVESDKIIKGIKQVWASPYSERSFRWRQSFLLNPENIYPSILVIPSVNVDYSGVLITKGVSSGNSDDLTIAFSRGAGGAVDGQAAESYVLKSDGLNWLISPAREPLFNVLPLTGGTGKATATFEKPILNDGNLSKIREFSKLLKQKMNETGSMNGPFDVELGFLDDKLWLFQVRPFVENRNAAGAAYLESISPKPDESKNIPISAKL